MRLLGRFLESGEGLLGQRSRNGVAGKVIEIARLKLVMRVAAFPKPNRGRQGKLHPDFADVQRFGHDHGEVAIRKHFHVNASDPIAFPQFKLKDRVKVPR